METKIKSFTELKAGDLVLIDNPMLKDDLAIVSTIIDTYKYPITDSSGRKSYMKDRKPVYADQNGDTGNEMIKEWGISSTIDYSSPNMSTDIIYSNLVVNIKISTPSGIKWNNIKDYFIALLQRLKDAYGLKDTCFFEFNEPIPFQVPGVGRGSMNINTNILLRDSVYSHSSTNPFWWDVFGELFIKSISIRVEKED